MIIYKPDLSDKLGDYPIITKKNAEELLCSGKYISIGEAIFPGKEYIRKTELVYRYGKENHYMPYYRIYVEIPTEKQDNNLNCYELSMYLLWNIHIFMIWMYGRDGIIKDISIKNKNRLE